MRLTEEELGIIRKTFNKYFTNEDHLWLFGSRVDDRKRGGDIDFYIETMEENVSKANTQKLDFIISLKQLLGDQKIDVILNQLKLQHSLPIYKEAKTTGVRLI